MTFRRIDSYATDDEVKLADQLSRLEDNITDALAMVPERLTWSDWVTSKNDDTRLTYGRVMRLDTSVDVLVAAFPSITPDTVGRVVGVKRKGANNVTLYPVDSATLIDGAASAVLGADGLYLYTHDGAEWSRY